MTNVYHAYSMSLQGMDGHVVTVECDLTPGLPKFILSGLPDASVSEARDRVRSAIKNSGFNFPKCCITVNLAPSHIKKIGTFYDLPILITLLCGSMQIQPKIDNCAFIGELSLHGELRFTHGILPMAMAAKREKIEHMFVPLENAREATLAEGPKIYGVKTVEDVVLHLIGEKLIEPEPLWIPPVSMETCLDFKEVKGQDTAKRALEIAAAGGHNILISGPPGSGKSMLARRLPSILPDMTKRESLEATEIHSILGMTNYNKPLITERPFRSPHHTMSAVSLAGGGPNPKPGEISLAHHGVLFLDEFPELKKEVIEVMRQPIEDGVVHISRVSGSATYPCNFMLVCAMNPCKCGWYGDISGQCRCPDGAVEKYLSKISGPILDRIDMFVQVAGLSYDELSGKSNGESSAEVKKRVNAARARQVARYEKTVCNALMTEQELERYATLDEESDQKLASVFQKFRITGRGHARIRRLARTIADLAGSEEIKVEHVREALFYRPQGPLGR